MHEYALHKALASHFTAGWRQCLHVRARCAVRGPPCPIWPIWHDAVIVVTGLSVPTPYADLHVRWLGDAQRSVHERM